MSKKVGLLIMLWVAFIPSVFAQEWLTKLDEAKSSAAETNQNILLVFSGSDWFILGMKLEKSIWSSEEFINNFGRSFCVVAGRLSEAKEKQAERRAADTQ